MCTSRQGSTGCYLGPLSNKENKAVVPNGELVDDEVIFVKGTAYPLLWRAREACGAHGIVYFGNMQ